MYLDNTKIPECLRLDDESRRDIMASKIAQLRGYFKHFGYERAVIGLSGGLDSAVALALAVSALGSGNVYALRLPFRTNNDKSLIVAEEVARTCALPESHLLTKNITKEVELSWKKSAELRRPANPQEIKIRLGNIAARMRMVSIMDLATHLRALVVGTENKTEHELAYFTIGGDNISNVEPISDLWKTQVFQIGEALGLPASVLDRAPSAELWLDQTDENELGVDYLTIDTILSECERLDEDDVLAAYPHISQATLRKVVGHVHKMRGKRESPKHLS